MTTPHVDIAGVGMHPFGRFERLALKDLARVAVFDALADAGLAPRDIGAAYVSNSLAGALQGQHQIRGQTVLRDLGFHSLPVVNVENACAGGSTALNQAIMAVRAGVCDTALALGFEKMYGPGGTGAALNALRSASDVDVTEQLGLQFTAVYAMRLRELLDTGAIEERHLAEVSVKNREHALLNPLAQFREPLTVDEVNSSRLIAEPLRLLMCGPICDGAAAAIVTSAGAGGRRRVRVRASLLEMGRGNTGDTMATVATTAAHAYDLAGIGPEEIDVIELHDAMAPGELLLYEHLGLTSADGPGELLDEGVTRLGGRQPVNPSGGLSSRGHPIGATGLGQIYELVVQLRGEAGQRQVADARTALAQNGGGWLDGEPAASVIHILERTA